MKKFFLIGLAEILLSVILLFNIPNLINGKYPQLGFLLLGAIPITLIGTGSYIGAKLLQAQKARQIFLNNFPQYQHLSTEDFLKIPASKVIDNLEILKSLEASKELEDINLNLLDILKHEN